MAKKIELSIVAKNQASAVLKDIRGDIDKLGSTAKSSKGSLSGMFDVAGGKLLASGIKSATSAIFDMGRAFVGLGIDAIQTGAKVDAQISGIAAVLKLTAEEVGQVDTLISGLAMNPNLVVDMQGAAGAVDMLARNGLDLKEIMGGAAESTVLLANATGGGFESAASVMTDVMQQWRGEAGSYEEITNGVVSATDASKMSLADYALAIAASGGTAAAAGVEFRDYNAALAAIVPLSSGGSDAGTSLKTMLQRLVPQSNEAKQAMGELGLYSFDAQNAMTQLAQMGIKPLGNDMGTLIQQLMGAFGAQQDLDMSTEKGIKAFQEWTTETGVVQNAFYDANGQLKGMADISLLLGDALSTLTEEQKNQYLTTIFGSDASRAAVALANQGTTAYTDLAKASKDLGVSQDKLAGYMSDGVITEFEAMLATMGDADAIQAAITRTDNLTGDMDKLSGTIEGVKKQLTKNLDPALRTVTQAMNAWLGNITPQLLEFGNVIGVQVTAGVKRITAAFAAFKSGGGVVDIAKALGISPKVIKVIELAVKHIGLIKGALKGIAVAVGGAAVISGIAAALGVLLNPLNLVIAAAALLGMAWQTNFGGIQDLTASVWGSIQPAAQAIWDWLAVTIPAALTTLQTQATEAQAVFDAVKIVAPSSEALTAAVATFAGADVTIDTAAQVISINWGDTFTHVYDVKSEVTTVNWLDGLGNSKNFIYDAKSQIASIDWKYAIDQGGAAFTYSAESGITKVNWNGGVDGFKYIYDADAGIVKVDWGLGTYDYSATATVAKVAWGLFAGSYTAVSSVTSVAWGVYYGSYEADAGITSVAWGLYSHTYQPSAEVISVLWGTYRSVYTADASVTKVLWGLFTNEYKGTAQIQSVLWGAYKGTYDASSSVTSVLWGAYSHQYDGTVNIGGTSIAWGAYTNTYQADVSVTNVLWGAYSKTYDAKAQIAAANVAWGAFTHSYDAKAEVGSGSVFWGAWTYTYDAAGNITSWTIGKEISWDDAFGFDLSWVPTITQLGWDSVFSFGMAWTASMAKVFSWADVFGFTLDWTPKISWPPIPGWLQWLMGQGSSVGGAPADPANNANGTRSFEGGWTWVGERGPELMKLPKGTEILSNTESKQFIANNADGTTTAGAAGGNKPTNVFSVIRDTGAQFKKAAEVIEKSNKELAKVQKDSMNDLKSALQKVPGLFSSSQVTDQQMKMAELGIPQNFADDYLRHFADEVFNGVDWADVDIADAAKRAGIDANLPIDAIYEIFKQKWDDKSLFANGNTDLINMDAVQAELAKQQQQKLGEANLLAMFGITPEQSTANGVAVGTSLGSGIQTGLSTSLSTGGAGEQIAAGLTGMITPEQMTPVSATVVNSLVTQIGDAANVDKVGASLVAMFSSYIEKPDAFGGIGNAIMGKISAQMGNVTGIDMVAKFSDAFRQQLGAEEAMASLANVGAKILELVFRGYLDASLAKNWAEGVNAKGKEESTTPVLAGNAIGTSNWRGGLTWVGETGPEIVALPARSRIYSNGESMAMAGGGDTHITIHATVNNGVDINDIAYRVTDIIRRRR